MHRHRQLLAGILLSTFATPAFFTASVAQELPRQLPQKTTVVKKKKAKTKRSRRKTKRNQINTQQAFQIQYGSNSWNSDSRQIDSAFILVRDANSGKMATVDLDETTPDSGVFSGVFRLDWGTVDKISPEMYVPPQSMREDKRGLERLGKMVREGRLKRKPFVTTSGRKGLRNFEVYDTAQQAREALKAFREQKALERRRKVKLKPQDTQPIAAEALFEAAKLAELKAKQAALIAEAARREAERIRLAQLEKQRERERLNRLKNMAEAEKKRRRAKAAKLAKLALEKYRKGAFKESVQLFEKSVELDPENRTYYYQYGVALYRINEFNKSIVVLNNAQGAQVNPVERTYFLGLNHFRLKEFETSLNQFAAVKKSKDKIMVPSAAFYSGLIHFTETQYEKAKPEFETVLDTSNDPRLDERAEQYIERIAQILYFAKQARTKYFLNGTFGLQYDSNVLFSSESAQDQGVATDIGGLRVLGIGSGKWRPIYTKAHEFATKLDVVYYYSFNSSFSSADPFLLTFKTPYTYKGTLFGKGFKLDTEVGYETLYLDALSTGSRDNILNSILLNTTSTFVMNPKWFMAFKLNARSDDSKLTVTEPADDSSATKFELFNQHTLLFGKSKDKIVIGDIGYTINSADGANNKYGRIDLKSSYIQPLKLWSWEMTWVNSLNYYLISYSERSDNRKDNNIALNTALSKKLTEIMTLGLTANYTKNSSNVDSFSYNKYTVMTSVSFDYSF